MVLLFLFLILTDCTFPLIVGCFSRAVFTRESPMKESRESSQAERQKRAQGLGCQVQSGCPYRSEGVGFVPSQRVSGLNVLSWFSHRPSWFESSVPGTWCTPESISVMAHVRSFISPVVQWTRFSPINRENLVKVFQYPPRQLCSCCASTAFLRASLCLSVHVTLKDFRYGF